MLRIDWEKGHIPTDYDDPYLELVRLLTEGAGIEQSLMLAYLYAMFSLRDQYHAVRGEVTGQSYLEHSPVGRGGTEVLKKKDTFLAVALEEMQHLSLVNWFLVELGAAPNFVPHQFPYTSDLYPFEIELRPLDRYVAAACLWVEADECKLSLDPACKASAERPEFIAEVRQVLKDGSKRYDEIPVDEQRVNHVGSLYHKIVLLTQQVAQNPPKFLPPEFPWGEWEARMNWILYQGEDTHYQFFRGVFTGEAFGGGAGVWTPGAEGYPAHDLEHRTAYAGQKGAIADPDARDLAWLGNLHYWILLCLLDVAYRSNTRKHVYKAIDHMTMAVWHLGRHLAERHRTGMPFDPMGPHYTPGRNNRFTLHLLNRLVLEARGKARALDERKLLPPRYDLELFEITLAGLGHLSQTGAPPPDLAEFRFA